MAQLSDAWGGRAQVKQYVRDLDEWKKGHPKEYNQLVHVHQMHNKSPYSLKGSDMINDIWSFIRSLKNQIKSLKAPPTPCCLCLCPCSQHSHTQSDVLRNTTFECCHVPCSMVLNILALQDENSRLNDDLAAAIEACMPSHPHRARSHQLFENQFDSLPTDPTDTCTVSCV